MKEIFQVFGFKNYADFTGSVIYTKPLVITVPLAAVGAFIENYLGMKWLTLVAFICLLVMEVVSGVTASMIIDKAKFSSIRFNRFLLKLAMWLICFFIVHSFSREYEVGTVMHGLFTYLYDAIMIFVTQQYLLSFIESIGKLSGKSNSVLIRLIVDKVSKVIDINGSDKQELTK